MVSIWMSPKTGTYSIETDQVRSGPCQSSVNTHRLFDSPAGPNHSHSTEMPPEQSTIIDASREPSQHTEGILGIHLRAVFNYPPGNFKRSDGDIPKMSSDFGPQRQQNLRRNLAPATKLYCYRNILTNNNN